MNKTLAFFTALPATVFLIIGVGWWLNPQLVGTQMGMALLESTGLSTQIGDLASFFITLGVCILLGLRTGNKIWLYPAIMLLAVAIIGRIIAWLFHGAALTIDIIIVEVSVNSWLFFVSTKLTTQSNSF